MIPRDEVKNVKSLRLGPERRHWTGEQPKGDCEVCGGDCDGDDCGKHAAGCVFGGNSDATSYWLIAEGCELYHGFALEVDGDEPRTGE